jgi:GT2 family glycosyltransferase/glycosyltransferase involved in cell wall biosynthesis
VPVSEATTVESARQLLAGAPSPVVVVAAYNGYDDVVRCLEAVATHTAPEVAVLVVEDAGADRRIVDALRGAADRLAHHVVVLHHQRNQGYVRCCNDGFAATPGRDVVLLNSDVVVGPEWLTRLTAAALGSDTVATASTLTNHGTILSVPHRNRQTPRLPDGLTPDEAARRVAAGSLRLRPAIPTAVGHCMYIRRVALDLVGPFDEAFSPGYGEEVDFSQRAVAHGFGHVCADDVFTFHRGGGSFGASAPVLARQARHEAVVRERYPWYPGWIQATETDPASELADALGAARRSLLGLSVGVDALCLGPDRMGTQHTVVESLRALARRPEIARLVAFVPPRPPAYVRRLRDELDAVEFVEIDHHMGPPPRTVDIAYRPYQVTGPHDVEFLARVGDRFVVNQLDTIAFENPAYFESTDAWFTYRDTTRLTLTMTHGVAFISERSRQAAAAQGLLAPGTPWAVVSSGLDAADPAAPDSAPAGLGAGDDGFLLYLGTSYLHKGRRFLLETWAELRRRGWDGRLVMAGSTPPFGNSLGREAEFLLGAPELRRDVVMLAAVTEAEKRWLYRHAALVVYPSTIEGFGFVPFEAAAYGSPTLSTRRGSLGEVLPADVPTLDGYDVARSADQAWELLHDPVAAKELTEAIRLHGESFTWDAVAERLVGLFAEALLRPRGRIVAVDGEGGRPVGVVRREPLPRGADRGAALERVVQAVINRPALKNGLSPDGTRRQRMARQMIAEARRRLG